MFGWTGEQEWWIYPYVTCLWLSVDNTMLTDIKSENVLLLGVFVFVFWANINMAIFPEHGTIVHKRWTIYSIAPD